MEFFVTYLIGNSVFLWSNFIIFGLLFETCLTKDLFSYVVSQSETVLLECSTSIPLESTWLFENTVLNLNRVIWDERFKQNGFITANYSLRIQNVSIQHEGLYQCTNGSGIFSNHSIRVEVIPMVYLTVNGLHPSDPYVIARRNENVIVTCVASNARPPVNISWFVDEKKVNSSSKNHQSITTRRSDNNTFDTSSSISFQPGNTIENITCVIGGLSKTGLLASVKLKVEKEQSTKNETKISTSLLPPKSGTASSNITLVITSPAVIALFTLVTLACVVKKLKGSRRPQHVYANQSESLEESCAVISDNERVCLRLPEECTAYSRRLGPESTNNNEKYWTNDSAYSFLPEFEGDFALQDVTLKRRNFNSTEMNLLLKMKTGPVFTKWMGTLSVDNKNTKPVVTTTVTDRTLGSKEFHWQEYVKRVLDLPNNKNLVSIVGICIDTENLYLLHEHVVGETLHKRIIHINNSADCDNINQMTPCEALLYVTGILEGMELIHSYGFLHPGLTTKKILVTDEGACKLYDFCLSEDANKRTAISKTQRICNLNNFAPEALLRNVYTKECDVWSIGVVIWEIISIGCQPFPSSEESVSTLHKPPSPPDEWPVQYPTLKNRRVFDCWEEEVSLRPSLNQLRLSFAKVSNSLKSCDDHKYTAVGQDGPLPLDEFCYTTMVGNTYDQT